ncbi:hypothetical protein BDF20DRAFT_917299 [Mycotypha africana]|uniref:uncharacterized protein n=1 Tax=Mycotypha africana TaxID=64632 RepID=UPI002300EAD5|nr:uncharacterized protein BDF20DRAFT_917299 [Mycotypha africana]KAI8967689.1 hypothetical protein BDF20DRAFT_917299 [Mycotypha africana]
MRNMPTSIKRRKQSTETGRSIDDNSFTSEGNLRNSPAEKKADLSRKKNNSIVKTASKVKRQQNPIKADDSPAEIPLKAMLNYVIQENEMLLDEFSVTQRELRKLKTERRLLLDVLVKKNGL